LGDEVSVLRLLLCGTRAVKSADVAYTIASPSGRVHVMRLLSAAAVMVLALTSCSAAAYARPHGSAVLPAVPLARRVIGVYEPNDPGSYGQVRHFAKVTGVKPGLVVYYSNWGMPFEDAFAEEVQRHGGKPLVQIDPRGVALAAIADGQQDSYLRSYAVQVRAYGGAVVISFGQEMNGPWYPWGSGHIAPAVFVAAWRHIVRLFRAEGARNVTWLWDVNCNFRGSDPISLWWPGRRYVNWAGVDCYYNRFSNTFDSLFGSTITDIRQLTGGPVVIGETAADPAAGQSAKIASLFAGILQYKLIGFVWFDQAQHGGFNHQDWRLDDKLAGLAAFRKGAVGFLRGAQ